MTADRYQGFVFNPADLSEDVDLTLEERKEILFAHAHLPTWTLFQVLGLVWDAPADAVRPAFLEKVKRFHPDRYPGKRLGRYQGRLEQVFRKLSQARDTLEDPARRAEYLRAAAPPDEFARAEVRRIEDELRADERRARLARTNPLVARAGRVAELIRRGKSSMEQGHFGPAANDFLIAAGLDPKNPELKTLAQEAKRRSESDRGRQAFERGMAAEVLGHWKQALGCYQEAREADPKSARYAVAAARAALEGGEVEQALGLAEEAVRLAPGEGAAHEALGAVLAARGEKQRARAELERALELDPGLKKARTQLKKLHWSVFG